MRSLIGKKALVTGAASGIGRAIAYALAREHVELYLLDMDAAGLAIVAEDLRHAGTRVETRTCDLADRAALDVRLNELLNDWDGVDIVVNNAGRAYQGPTDSMSDEQWDAVLGVNLLAPAQIVRRLLPSLKQREDAQIVNIASVAGLVAFKRISAYCLTKFGLVGFSESLRGELGRFGIGVTLVCPAFVQTRLFRATLTAHPGKRTREPAKVLCHSPEQIAKQVVDAIRKNRAMVIPGLGTRWFCRLKRFAPGLVAWLLNGRSKRPANGSSKPATSTPARAAA